MLVLAKQVLCTLSKEACACWFRVLLQVKHGAHALSKSTALCRRNHAHAAHTRRLQVLQQAGPAQPLRGTHRCDLLKLMRHLLRPPGNTLPTGLFLTKLNFAPPSQNSAHVVPAHTTALNLHEEC